MEYRILGSDIQVLEMTLRNEKVYSEAGSLMYCDPSITMNTEMKGGFLKGLARKFLAGESLFLPSFSGNGTIAFAAPAPGKIIKIDINSNKNFIAQKDAFLCCTENVELSITFTKKLGAGFFGGEGFILEKITGDGQAFIHACGEIIEKNLSPNERILVDTGCIVGFDTTVDYDIKFIGGIKNIFFGGEGLFLVQLTGPGKVYLQSLPLSRLAERIIGGFTYRQEENKGLFGSFGTFISGDN